VQAHAGYRQTGFARAGLSLWRKIYPSFIERCSQERNRFRIE
jgi:hypothetical protein